MPKDTISRRIVVAGRVQGVGYRVACATVANRLGLAGAVRNLEDGRVEAVALGSPDAVDALIQWCRQGPRAARVDDVIVSDGSISGVDVAEGRFRILG